MYGPLWLVIPLANKLIKSFDLKSVRSNISNQIELIRTHSSPHQKQKKTFEQLFNFWLCSFALCWVWLVRLNSIRFDGLHFEARWWLKNSGQLWIHGWIVQCIGNGVMHIVRQTCLVSIIIMIVLVVPANDPDNWDNLERLDRVEFYRMIM